MRGIRIYVSSVAGRSVAFAVALILVAGRAGGQGSSSRPSFDAASLKVEPMNLQSMDAGSLRSHRRGMNGGPGTEDPGRFRATQVVLSTLLKKAWGIPMTEGYRIVGPGWLSEIARSYTIEAAMPPGTTKQEFQLMLQELLIERFRMRLHHESRLVPGYELLVAPGGAKLRVSSASAEQPSPAEGRGAVVGTVHVPTGFRGTFVSLEGSVWHVDGRNVTVAEFVDERFGALVFQATGVEFCHVVDKTNLSGRFDFALQFSARSAAPAVTAGPQVRSSATAEAASDGLVAADPSGAPSLFRALERQLGLQLKRVGDVAVDVIVIDHAEPQPIEN